MNVPFLDLKIQYQAIKDEINPAIQQVLDNASYVLGKAVADFESEFRREHGVRHCFGVSSGTDGNHMALWALGIGPGDEVLCPTFTFFATAGAISRVGATPVFVDSCPVCFNVDVNSAKKKLTARSALSASR